MKKLIVGLLAIGAVMALRPAVKRRMVEMREHCKQMMGAQSGAHSEATGHEAMGPERMRQRMREHCEQMAAQYEERSEPVAMA